MTIQILKSVAIHKTMVLRFIVRTSEIRGHKFAGLAITHCRGVATQAMRQRNWTPRLRSEDSEYDPWRARAGLDREPTFSFNKVCRTMNNRFARWLPIGRKLPRLGIYRNFST